MHPGKGDISGQYGMSVTTIIDSEVIAKIDGKNNENGAAGIGILSA